MVTVLNLHHKLAGEPKTLQTESFDIRGEMLLLDLNQDLMITVPLPLFLLHAIVVFIALKVLNMQQEHVKIILGWVSIFE